MHVPMFAALGFKETAPTSENNIRPLEEFSFKLQYFRRSTLKSRQLIHTVIHSHLRAKMFCVQKSHRRVVPRDETADPALGKPRIQEFALFDCMLRMRHLPRNERSKNLDAAKPFSMKHWRCYIGGDWFLKKENIGDLRCTT